MNGQCVRLPTIENTIAVRQAFAAFNKSFEYSANIYAAVLSLFLPSGVGEASPLPLAAAAARPNLKGHFKLPEGGRPRDGPLTRALASALVRARHLRGERVLYREDGTPVSQQAVRSWMSASQKRAGLKVTGALHILRHTLCSHLAICGACRLSRSRSWQATAAFAPPCATCTWGRGEAPSHPDAGGRAGYVSNLETCWRRAGARKHRGRKPLRFQQLPAPIEVSPTGFEPVLPA